MKKIIVSGSLAYDRIMIFPDQFSDHILPEKLNDINVCFMVDGVTENFGGTAGNIAYALKLMGEDPIITATIGSDYHRYFDWLDKNGIVRDGITVVSEELTAGAYITTDNSNNQITNFNPGAMKQPSGLKFDELDAGQTIVHISPGNLEDMVQYALEAQKFAMDYIFDPGQALPMLQGEDLSQVINGANLLIVNDYEFNLILDKTGLSKAELLKLPQNTIITMGDKGSELYEGESMTPIPPFTARVVVDPTGAGDSYRGGLLSGLARGKDLKTSAMQGSVCSSFAVECNGTQVYTFSNEEFEQRLNTQ